MPAASPASGTVGSVIAVSMLERRESELFLKKNCSLATVSGRHRRSCLRKLATSKPPGTDYASRPIPTIFITVPSSEALKDSELLRLSSFVNMLSGLVL